MESHLSTDLVERLRLEGEAERESSRLVLPSGCAHRMWVAAFLDNFVARSSFADVIQGVETWAHSMSTELRLDCPILNHVKAQVNRCFFTCCMLAFSYMLHDGRSDSCCS